MDYPRCDIKYISLIQYLAITLAQILDLTTTGMWTGVLGLLDSFETRHCLFSSREQRIKIKWLEKAKRIHRYKDLWFFWISYLYLKQCQFLANTTPSTSRKRNKTERGWWLVPPIYWKLHRIFPDLLALLKMWLHAEFHSTKTFVFVRINIHDVSAKKFVKIWAMNLKMRNPTKLIPRTIIFFNQM